MTDPARPLPETLVRALDLIRPVLQKDGGDLELIDWTEEGVLRARLAGRCSSCPKAGHTLKNIVERTLLKLAPEMRRVEQTPEEA